MKRAMVRVDTRLQELNRLHSAPATAAPATLYDVEMSAVVEPLPPVLGTHPSQREPCFTDASLPLGQATGTPLSMPNPCTQWHGSSSITQLTPNHTQLTAPTPSQAQDPESDLDGGACACGAGPQESIVRLVLQIHDELLLEVRDHHVSHVAAEVQRVMEDASLWSDGYADTSVGSRVEVSGPAAGQGHARGTTGPRPPPLVVKLRVGSSWGSLEPFDPAKAPAAHCGTMHSDGRQL